MILHNEFFFVLGTKQFHFYKNALVLRAAHLNSVLILILLLIGPRCLNLHFQRSNLSYVAVQSVKAVSLPCIDFATVLICVCGCEKSKFASSKQPNLGNIFDGSWFCKKVTHESEIFL